MNIRANLLYPICTILLLLNCRCFSQTSPKVNTSEGNKLFTAGYANAFIAGLYDGFYPYTKLKRHGNFGLGAPDKLDGELMILDGKIYQTQSSGKTFEVQSDGKCPFAVVNFFNSEKEYTIKKEIKKDSLLKFLDSVLQNKNGIYAIRINGKFSQVKTRAFPAVEQKPYSPLASMLDKQQFFSFSSISGDFIGYRIPSYMEGANISGYHFHFLSHNKNSGGHVIDFKVSDVRIQIDELNNFEVELPKTAEFAEFDFSKNRTDEVKSVETGKKE